MTPKEFHPLANLLPLMEGEAFDELVGDIQQHGLREPVVLHNDKILDGRNRYLACEAAGVEPRFKDYSGDDPAAYVISLNLHRRHLTASQRSMAAASLANMETGKYYGNQHEGGANLPEAPVTTNDAAEMLNVSERSVKAARKVQRDGIDELINAVKDGSISVSKAAKIAQNLPEEKQADAIKLPSPRQAIKMAREGGGGVVLASDLKLYDGRSLEQMAAEHEVTMKLAQCFNGLESLANMELSIDEFIKLVPDYRRFRVDKYLSAAYERITELKEKWGSNHVEAAE